MVQRLLQLIGPIDDMKPYDQEDAQLQGFDAGTPRFYIMRCARLTHCMYVMMNRKTQGLNDVCN